MSAVALHIKNWVNVVCFSICYLFVGMLSNIFSPYLPLLGLEKGLTYTEVGWIFGAGPIISILQMLFQPYFFKREMLHIIYMIGMLSTAFGLFCCGLLVFCAPHQFFSLMLATMCVTFSASAVIPISSFPLIIAQLPNHSGKIAALIAGLHSAGTAIGSSFGAVLYHIGGGSILLPTSISGLILLITWFIQIFTITSLDEAEKMWTKEELYSSDSGSVQSQNSEDLITPGEKDEKPKIHDYLKEEINKLHVFFSHPETVGLFVASILTTSLVYFQAIGLAPYIHNYYHVQNEYIGYVYMSTNVPGVLFPFVIGPLVDKGYAGHIAITGTLVGGFGVIFYIASNDHLWLLIIGMFCEGFAATAVIAPLYLLFEKIQQNYGYFNSDNNKMNTATVMNLSNYGAQLIAGFVTAGPLIHHLGFDWTFVILLIMQLVGAFVLIAVVILQKFYKRIFV